MWGLISSVGSAFDPVASAGVKLAASARPPVDLSGAFTLAAPLGVSSHDFSTAFELTPRVGSVPRDLSSAFALQPISRGYDLSGAFGTAQAPATGASPAWLASVLSSAMQAGSALLVANSNRARSTAALPRTYTIPEIVVPRDRRIPWVTVAVLGAIALFLIWHLRS